jgi:hypothetical protein
MIYLLPPQELDDKTLDKQIKTIAQTLCNVHWYYNIADNFDQVDPAFDNAVGSINIPMPYNDYKNEISCWARDCLANYKQLVDIGLACCDEWCYRNSPDAEFEHGGTELHLHRIDSGGFKRHKLEHIIKWARDNVPDLPNNLQTKVAEKDGVSWLYNEQQTTPFPLVMPDEYHIYNMNSVYKIKDECLDLESRKDNNLQVNTVESYRNYYQAKLPKDAQWTRREKPNWLK